MCGQRFQVFEIAGHDQHRKRALRPPWAGAVPEVAQVWVLAVTVG